MSCLDMGDILNIFSFTTTIFRTSFQVVLYGFTIGEHRADIWTITRSDRSSVELPRSDWAVLHYSILSSSPQVFAQTPRVNKLFNCVRWRDGAAVCVVQVHVLSPLPPWTCKSTGSLRKPHWWQLVFAGSQQLVMSSSSSFQAPRRDHKFRCWPLLGCHL